VQGPKKFWVAESARSTTIGCPPARGRVLLYPCLVEIAVLIPALNEEEAIPELLADLRAALPSARIVVVDNGSTDTTAFVAKAEGAEVVSEPTRGYGSACLAGIRHLMAAPPEVVVILDADHADDPAFLPDFVKRIAGGADLVLSTRTQGGAEPGSLTPVQVWGNRLQTSFLRLRFGLPLTDMGPMRAVAWESLLRFNMQDRSWGWNVEMAAKAARLGLTVAEVPVTYRCRRTGESKISGSLRGALRAGGKILYALGKYGL
jgi:glycosyltransferase involved in cell wall biosynthesis